MRQIDEVIGTQDGSHVIALCTDGGVLHFTTSTSTSRLSIPMASLEGSVSLKISPSGDHESQDANCADLQGATINAGSVIEFSQLKRNPDLDSAWCLKRVGAEGRVVLLR